MEVEDLFDELEKAFDGNVQNVAAKAPTESEKEVIGDAATTSAVSDIPTPMDIDENMLFNIPLPPTDDTMPTETIPLPPIEELIPTETIPLPPMEEEIATETIPLPPPEEELVTEIIPPLPTEEELIREIIPPPPPTEEETLTDTIPLPPTEEEILTKTIPTTEEEEEITETNFPTEEEEIPTKTILSPTEEEEAITETSSPTEEMVTETEDAIVIKETGSVADLGTESLEETRSSFDESQEAIESGMDVAEESEKVDVPKDLKSKIDEAESEVENVESENKDEESVTDLGDVDKDKENVDKDADKNVPKDSIEPIELDDDKKDEENVDKDADKNVAKDANEAIELDDDDEKEVVDKDADKNVVGEDLDDEKVEENVDDKVKETKVADDAKPIDLDEDKDAEKADDKEPEPIEPKNAEEPIDLDDKVEEMIDDKNEENIGDKDEEMISEKDEDLIGNKDEEMIDKVVEKKSNKDEKEMDDNAEKLIGIDEDSSTISVKSTGDANDDDKIVDDKDKPTSDTKELDSDDSKNAETAMEVDEEKNEVEQEIPDICSDNKSPVDISSDKSSDSTKEKSTEIASVTVDDVEDLAQNDESRDPIQEDNSTNLDNNQLSPAIAEESEPMLVEVDKFTITHYNEEETKTCCICEKVLVPKYIAQRENDSIHICDNDCYVAFKDKHGDNIIEKLIRLRSFATQDKKKAAQNTVNEEQSEMEFEWEGDEEPKDSLRKCGTCKNNFDIDNYISWEAVDFCNEACLLAYQRTINSACQKCRKDVGEIMLGKFCVRFGNIITQFCSTTCLLSYKKTNKFCAYCQEDLRNNSGEFKNFCSKRCLDVCQPERPPSDCCAVCHQVKPVNVKIRNSGKIDHFCGEPCFVAYKFVNQVNPVRCEACPTYFVPNSEDPIIYTEGLTHMLCSKDCQKIYLITNRKIVICRCCSVKKYDFDMVRLCENQKDIAFACSNTCLKACFERTYDEQVDKSSDSNVKQLETVVKDAEILVGGISLTDMVKLSHEETKNAMHKITITKPRPYIKQRNIATMCQPNLVSKSTNCMFRSVNTFAQTDTTTNRYYVPIPVPIFVPVPCHMNVVTVPMPYPLPIPLPVPIFIPTTRKSMAGISKEIKKIKNRVPADPLEAELLMMAEMAAGDKIAESSSESEAEDIVKAEQSFQTEAMEDTSGDDVLSMAYKMASNFDETSEIESTTSAPGPTPKIETVMEAKRKIIRQPKAKRKHELPTPAPPPPQINLEIEKPDVNLCLKYTFGVNAWKQWVTIKNQELTKTQKRPKLFKPEILQLTADDLNFSLCLFVKEVRKPNGAEYAPDTIYYLCLGIQQYLYENGRIDNIFCDPFYEKFTDMFNEVCQKFAQLYNDSQYIVTRVEEEHLWESKQLGAHSPLVLLNTLMFFNTKHFSLTTVDEHLQLSFSHIMKHWKRNPSHPGSRNVLLRFYPPQNVEGGKKKKVYEQQENDENPLRCPVKLYEFYLSKCPESVKTRNDVFYLLPERSCVPDSPVWYSTMALDKEPLEKMLNRVKMIKEINVALLTT